MRKSRLQFLVIVSILGIPLLINYLSTLSPGGFSDVGTPGGREAGIIMGKEADIDGDGQKEILRLRAEPGQYFELQGLNLEVIDGDSTLRVPLEGEGFATATLNLVQMDDDSLQEVFVTLVSSGVSGLQQLHGFQFKDGNQQTLFGPEFYLKSSEFDLEYLGDKRVRFKDLTTGLTATLDFNDNPNYADFTEAELERLYNAQSAWSVAGYSGFSWADLNGDGNKEIIGSRSVTGVTSADLVGTLQEYYRKEAEVYKPYAQAFFSPGGVEEAGIIIKGTER